MLFRRPRALCRFRLNSVCLIFQILATMPKARHITNCCCMPNNKPTYCIHKKLTKFTTKLTWFTAELTRLVYEGQIPYSGKFLRGSTFTDWRSSNVSRNHANTYIICKYAYFVGLIFAVHESTMKTVKIGPLENFMLYGTSNQP